MFGSVGGIHIGQTEYVTEFVRKSSYSGHAGSCFPFQFRRAGVVHHPFAIEGNRCHCTGVVASSVDGCRIYTPAVWPYGIISTPFCFIIAGIIYKYIVHQSVAIGIVNGEIHAGRIGFCACIHYHLHRIHIVIIGIIFSVVFQCLRQFVRSHHVKPRAESAHGIIPEIIAGRTGATVGIVALLVEHGRKSVRWISCNVRKVGEIDQYHQRTR